MKKYILVLAVFVMVSMGFVTINNETEAEKKGKEIFEKVLAVNDGNTRKSSMTIIKINRRGKKRVEKIVNLVKEGEVEKTLFFTTYPADVRGVGFLSFDYHEDGKDDDRWLYLPATKKTRRISSAASRNEYFLGTDFTYRDAEKPEADEEKWIYVKDVNKEGVYYWEVERYITDGESNYSKMVSLIDQSNHLIIETQYFDKRGELMKSAIASGIKEINGFWTALETHMINHQKNHQTILKTENIEFDIEIDDHFFTVMALENGVID
ncbi:MAG: outer membrane lipoprotein-sorting protein [Kordia sp.]|nr:MAG: outer membrane lipoprotein-sorting protein [Kordia sp.]